MAKFREYRYKVFIYVKDGLRKEAVFDLSGKNKKARAEADAATVAVIKRMVCEEGCEFLATVYRDESKRIIR